MFSWLVTQVSEKGLAGASVSELSETLNSKAVQKPLAELLSLSIPAQFGESTPSDLFKAVVGSFKELDAQCSRLLDEHLRPTHALSEDRLEVAIRKRTHLRSPTGLAVPMVLLTLTLARYVQWEGTNFGNWLATASTDPYLDLVPPALTHGLNRRFGRWWTCKWKELTEFVLGRYVVQQHQSMSYEKTAKGDRCLLQVDDGKITTRPHEVFEKIGMGNPRFRSAVRILTDLGLLAEEDGMTALTKDGKKLLDEELAKEGRA